MIKIKNIKIRFKFLLFTVVAALLSSGAMQSSLAMHKKNNLNKSKFKKQTAQFDYLNNNSATTDLNTENNSIVNYAEHSFSPSLYENVKETEDKIEDIQSTENNIVVTTENSNTNTYTSVKEEAEINANVQNNNINNNINKINNEISCAENFTESEQNFIKKIFNIFKNANKLGIVENYIKGKDSYSKILEVKLEDIFRRIDKNFDISEGKINCSFNDEFENKIAEAFINIIKLLNFSNSSGTSKKIKNSRKSITTYSDDSIKTSKDILTHVVSNFAVLFVKKLKIFIETVSLDNIAKEYLNFKNVKSKTQNFIENPDILEKFIKNLLNQKLAPPSDFLSQIKETSTDVIFMEFTTLIRDFQNNCTSDLPSVKLYREKLNDVGKQVYKMLIEKFIKDSVSRNEDSLNDAAMLYLIQEINNLKADLNTSNKKNKNNLNEVINLKQKNSMNNNKFSNQNTIEIKNFSKEIDEKKDKEELYSKSKKHKIEIEQNKKAINQSTLNANADIINDIFNFLNNKKFFLPMQCHSATEIEALYGLLKKVDINKDNVYDALIRNNSFHGFNAESLLKTLNCYKFFYDFVNTICEYAYLVIDTFECELKNNIKNNDILKLKQNITKEIIGYLKIFMIKFLEDEFGENGYFKYSKNLTKEFISKEFISKEFEAYKLENAYKSYNSVSEKGAFGFKLMEEEENFLEFITMNYFFNKFSKYFNQILNFNFKEKFIDISLMSKTWEKYISPICNQKSLKTLNEKKPYKSKFNNVEYNIKSSFSLLKIHVSRAFIKYYSEKFSDYNYKRITNENKIKNFIEKIEKKHIFSDLNFKNNMYNKFFDYLVKIKNTFDFNDNCVKKNEVANLPPIDENEFPGFYNNFFDFCDYVCTSVNTAKKNVMFDNEENLKDKIITEVLTSIKTYVVNFWENSFNKVDFINYLNELSELTILKEFTKNSNYKKFKLDTNGNFNFKKTEEMELIAFLAYKYFNENVLSTNKINDVISKDINKNMNVMSKTWKSLFSSNLNMSGENKSNKISIAANGKEYVFELFSGLLKLSFDAFLKQIFESLGYYNDNAEDKNDYDKFENQNEIKLNNFSKNINSNKKYKESSQIEINKINEDEKKLADKSTFAKNDDNLFKNVLDFTKNIATICNLKKEFFISQIENELNDIFKNLKDIFDFNNERERELEVSTLKKEAITCYTSFSDLCKYISNLINEREKYITFDNKDPKYDDENERKKNIAAIKKIIVQDILNAFKTTMVELLKRNFSFTNFFDYMKKFDEKSIHKMFTKYKNNTNPDQNDVDLKNNLKDMKEAMNFVEFIAKNYFENKGLPLNECVQFVQKLENLNKISETWKFITNGLKNIPYDAHKFNYADKSKRIYKSFLKFIPLCADIFSKYVVVYFLNYNKKLKINFDKIK